jgi:hypothetical protein
MTMAPERIQSDGSIVERGCPTIERATLLPAKREIFVFLDADDEVDVDVEWTRENVAVLAEQWGRAEEILDRITALTHWIEADLPAHFARLVDAVLERDHHLAYLHERRCYAFEITPEGIVAVQPDEPAAIPLPIGAAV